MHSPVMSPEGPLNPLRRYMQLETILVRRNRYRCELQEYAEHP